MKTKTLKLSLLIGVVMTLWSCKKNQTPLAHTNVSDNSLELNIKEYLTSIKSNPRLTQYSETEYDKMNMSLILKAKEGEKIQLEDDLTELNSEMEILFQNYFNSMSEENMSELEITNFFINIIPNLNMQPSSKESCLESLSLFKVFFEDIYLTGSTPWDDRYDNCMRLKAKAVFVDGNWVDQAGFMLVAGETILWWAGACAWEATFPSS